MCHHRRANVHTYLCRRDTLGTQQRLADNIPHRPHGRSVVKLRSHAPQRAIQQPYSWHVSNKREPQLPAASADAADDILRHAICGRPAATPTSQPERHPLARQRPCTTGDQYRIARALPLPYGHLQHAPDTGGYRRRGDQPRHGAALCREKSQPRAQSAAFVSTIL